MTMKEIEALTGMTRANIRFYESEGMIEPHRNSNGYRNYSEADIMLLNKIKLLRTLHFSIEEIKCLQKGSSSLHFMLDNKIKHLRDEQQELQSSEQICLQISQEGANFETLDAKHYLDCLQQLSHNEDSVFLSDRNIEIHCPWKRFFARCFDLFFYSTIWYVSLTLIGNTNLALRSNIFLWFDSLCIILLLLALEPLQLTFFGTTIGKWLLGLKVCSLDETKLTYLDALDRTWTVLSSGLGFYLPGYRLFRLWKSYSTYTDGKPLPWEKDSVIELKDEKLWRYGSYILSVVISLSILVFCISYSIVPPHHGNISEDEFYENYAFMEKYFQADSEAPTFTFKEKNNEIVSIEFHIQSNEPIIFSTAYQEQMIFTSLAFVGGRKEFSPLQKHTEKLISYISNHSYESFQFQIENIHIQSNVLQNGYVHADDGILIQENDDSASFSLHYTISLEE